MQDENHNRQNDSDVYHDPMDTGPAVNADMGVQTDAELGTLITSGLGKDTRWSPQFFMMLAASAIVPIGAGYFLATQFGHRLVVSDVLGLSLPARTVFYYVYLCVGVVLAVALVFVQLLIREQIGKTEIFVYEKGIEGVGLKAGMTPGVLSGGALRPFRLTYDRISMVSAGQRAATLGIMINTQDEVFGVYPPNIAEILSVVSRGG